MKRWGGTLGVVVIAVAGVAGVLRWRANREAGAGAGDPQRQVWIDRLAEADPRAGAAAVDELVSMGEPGRRYLLLARADSNLRVHRRAVGGLVRVGEAAVEPLLADLSRGGARVETAIVLLGPAAVPGLEKALRGGQAAAAARLLGLLGERAAPAVPELVGLVQDGAAAKPTRVAAITSLGRIGPALTGAALAPENDPIIPALTAALGSEDLRLPAARALTAFGVAAGPAVPDLARLARDRDADVAEVACTALGATGSAAAAVPLVEALGRGGRVGPAAGLALARLGPAARPAVPALVAALASEKEKGQLARAVLERLGAEAVPALEAALAEKAPRIRREAAGTLALIGTRARQAGRALSACFADPEAAVQVAAAEASLRVDPDRVDGPGAVLRRYLPSKEERLAARASLALASLGDRARPALPEVRTLLGGKADVGVARAALVAGGIHPPAKEVIDALTAGLTRPGPVRVACAVALGRLGGEARPALAALRQALGDDRGRAAAALALVRISPREGPGVAERLSDDLASKDEGRAGEALAALDAMEPPPAEILPALRPLLGEPRLGRGAMRVLSRFEPAVRARVIPDLVSLLGSSEATLQLLAAWQLRKVGRPALPGLTQAMRSKNERTRFGAAVALTGDGFAGAVGDVSPLFDALEEGDSALREAAGEALGNLGLTREADVARAVEFLARPEADLRRAAARALGRVPAASFTAVAPHLVECLLDPDEGVRGRAAQALGAGSGPEPALLRALHDASYAVRLAAAESLSRRGAGGAGEVATALTTLARVVDGDALFGVADVLFRIDPAAAAALRGRFDQLLRGDDVETRTTAAFWLARLDPAALPATLDFLGSIVSDWEARAQIVAAEALGRLGPRAAPAGETLRRRRRVETDRDVRAAIDRALVAIKAPG